MDDDSTRSIPYSVSTETETLRPGDRLGGRFVIVQFLARGGMGEVYEAADDHLQGKHCALKTLRPQIANDPDMRARFEREVMLAREVSHPNVCPMFDIFREETPRGPLLFLTMKLLRGESLSARLNRGGSMPGEAAMHLAKQMAAALDAAHKAGVIHRDFKPGNVMLEGSGADTRVSITDFGLSRLYESDSTLSETGRISGTAGYIAPELLQGHVATPASDVYAFGIVLHEMLTGSKPTTKSHKFDFVRPSSLKQEVSRGWDRVIFGCLTFDPSRRFQSASEALAAYDAPSMPRSASRTLHVSRRAWLPAVAVLLLALLAISWWQAGRIRNWLHPLPRQRFVALLAWPPSDATNSADEPLLRASLDAIAIELVRAEPSARNFVLLSPSDAGQPAPKVLSNVVNTLGANLVLGVSLKSENSGYLLALKIMDPASSSVLRHDELSASSANVARLPERARQAALQLLDLPSVSIARTDEEELAALPAATYRIFEEAEESFAQPNDAGLDVAIEKYQRALDQAPGFALGYANLSIAYSRKFQLTHDDALLSLSEKNAALALKYHSESAKAVFASALVKIFRGETEEALNGIHNALRLDPGNPRIMQYEARLFRDMSRSADEEQVLREIVRQRPNFWPGYNELGTALFRQNKYKDAAAAFGEAAAVAPRIALPLANQGAMYLLLGDDSSAEESFVKSIQRAPNEVAYVNLGAIQFKRGDYRAALESYRQALELRPKNDKTWRNVADCYHALGDPKKEQEALTQAATVLTESLRTNPRPAASWMSLAFYQAKTGKRPEAEQAMKMAEQRGLDRRAQFLKAQTLAVLGRKEEAIALLLQELNNGLSPVDVALAPDLTQLRQDPRLKRRLDQPAVQPK